MLNKSQKTGIFVIICLAVTVVPTYFLAVQNIETTEKQILAYSNGNFFVWSENSATRIDPNFKPLAKESDVNNIITISAARREFESTQIIIRSLNQEPLENISVALSPFKNEVGKSIIGVENQSIGLVDLIRGEFFDRIMPLQYYENKFTINESRNYPLWFTVYVDENVTEGTYTSNLNITLIDGTRSTIQIKLRVYDFSLPIQHTYQSMVNPMTSNLNLMENFFDHRIDFSGVPMNVTFNATTLQWTFSWDEWDELTEYAISRGQNQFMISSPGGFVSTFEQYGVDYNYSIQTYYFAVATHLRLKGWIDRGYIYYIDEPSIEECVEFEPFCRLVHGVDEGLRILLTTAPRKEIAFLYDDIDIWAPIEHDLDKNYDTLMKLRALGKEVVFYPCLFPKTPYANIQAYNQLIDSKVLAWQVFHYDIDGFLYWQVSAYYYNMYGYGYNSWLDGWLIYPRDTANGIYDSSIRWDALRDGFEDIEYFYILKDLNKTHILYQDEITSLLNQMDGIMNGFRTFSDDPKDYISFRNDAALLIEEIQNSI